LKTAANLKFIFVNVQIISLTATNKGIWG